MSRVQARRLSWGVSGLLAVMLVVGLVAWQFVWAEDVEVKVVGEGGPEESSGDGGVKVKVIGEGDDENADGEKKPEKVEGTFSARVGDYDLAAIDADADYYTKSIPNRVWQRVAPPAGKKRHPQIIITNDPIRTVTANGKLADPLAVRALPGRPVTFTALDSGYFANKEISITVKADGQGVASAEFWVEDIGEYRVLAGSPENEGPAEFLIQAVTAGELADINSGKYARDYRATVEAAKRDREQRKQRLDDAVRAKRAAQQKD